jgi:hypothetical protein
LRRSYKLIYKNEDDNPIIESQNTNGTVFFQAVSPTNMSMVQIVANVVIEGRQTSGEVKLHCHTTPKHLTHEIFEYAGEVSEGSETLQQIYIVPKHSQCLFIIAGSSGGSYQLHYKKGTEDIIILKGKMLYSRESVFFEASTPPDNVQASTILYDGINMPGLVTLDLQCIDEFPQDQISEETRAIVLMANATGCSFSTLNLLDTTKDPSCFRGEGYYHVYNGTDMLPEKLLILGCSISRRGISQLQDRSYSAFKLVLYWF